jgi:hypothetical protein
MRSIRGFTRLATLSLLLPATTFAFSNSCKLLLNTPRTVLPHQKNQYSTSTTCLFEKQPEKRSGGSIRFSGIETTHKSDELTNSFDSVLSFLSSDIVSIVLGGVGLFVIVAHRLSLIDEVLDPTSMVQQTRTDLLAVFACGSVLLEGITKLDITSALSDSVSLNGVVLDEPNVNDDSDDDASIPNPTISWALQSLLQATPCMSAVVMEKKKNNKNEDEWTITAMAGTMPGTKVPVPDVTPILDRVASQTIKETYLPTLQALPGKFEFTYLPSNTQLALLIPIRVGQVLVLGSNTAKSFSPRDVAWCRVVAERMNTTS